MNLPNTLTVTRICLVPLLVVVLLTKITRSRDAIVTGDYVVARK